MRVGPTVSQIRLYLWLECIIYWLVGAVMDGPLLACWLFSVARWESHRVFRTEVYLFGCEITRVYKRR